MRAWLDRNLCVLAGVFLVLGTLVVVAWVVYVVALPECHFAQGAELRRCTDRND